MWARVRSAFASLVCALVGLGAITNYPIISASFSNGHFFFTPVALMFHCKSAVALFRQPSTPRVFSFQEIPQRKQPLAYIIKKQRRSKRFTETGDAFKSFCLDVVYLMLSPIPLARAWPVAMPTVTSRKHSKLHGTGSMCNTHTEMWVGVKDCKQ